MIRRPLATLSLLLALPACSSGTEPGVTLWEATLSPVTPATISGVAAAVAQAGKTRVSVEIRQATPGDAYGWRLSRGTCAAEGTIVGGAALYPTLTPDASRIAKAEAAAPGQLTPGGSYAVRVFRSAAPAQAVACGALLETG